MDLWRSSRHELLCICDVNFQIAITNFLFANTTIAIAIAVVDRNDDRALRLTSMTVVASDLEPARPVPVIVPVVALAVALLVVSIGSRGCCGG